MVLFYEMDPGIEILVNLKKNTVWLDHSLSLGSGVAD
jgi:hypothetical protein